MALGQLAGIGPLKLALIAITGLGLTVGGAFAVGIVGTPDVVGVDNSFGDVDDSTTEIESELEVHNPNPIGVTLGGLSIDYEVRMNGIPMATGGREGVDVERGNSTIPFRSEMDNGKIPDWWVSHLRNDENTTLEIHADVRSSLLNRTFDAPAVERTINTSLIEAFNSEEDRELEANQALIDDPILIVRETRGEWGTVDEEETEIEMEFVVYNPRPYPVTITDLGYDIRMNGVQMGEGETGESYVIPPGETTTIEATTRMDNQNLDEWWVSHLQNDQVTDLEVDFYMRIDLTEGGGDTVTVPLDTMEQRIETDMFDEKSGSDTGSDGSDESAGSDGSTESDESGDQNQIVTDQGDDADDTVDDTDDTVDDGDTILPGNSTDGLLV